MINFYDTEEKCLHQSFTKTQENSLCNNFAIKLLVKIHIFLFVTENFDSLTESPWVWSWTDWMKLAKLFVLVYFTHYTKLGSVFNLVLFIFQNKSSALINVHLDFEGNIGWEKLHITLSTHQNRPNICHYHGSNHFWNTII